MCLKISTLNLCTFLEAGNGNICNDLKMNLYYIGRGLYVPPSSVVTGGGYWFDILIFNMSKQFDVMIFMISLPLFAHIFSLGTCNHLLNRKYQ